MFLDFLYPAGTINFLRQFSGWGVDRQDARWARSGFAKLGQRLYTSSAKDPPIAVQAKTPPDEGAGTLVDAENDVDILRDKMGLTRPNDYEEAWRQYLLLEDSDQNRVRRQLIAYYSTSNRVLDAERTIDLFEGVKPEERDAATYQRTIRAYLRLRNLQDATLLYKTSLETLENPAGSAELLAYLFNQSSWSRAYGIWLGVEQLKQKHPIGDYDIYRDVQQLPNFGDLVCDLAEHADKMIAENIGEDKRPEKTVEGEMTMESEMTVEPDVTDHPPEIFAFTATLVRMALLQQRSFNKPRFEKLLGLYQKWRLLNRTVIGSITNRLMALNELELLIKFYEKVRSETWTKFNKPTLESLLGIFCRSHDARGMHWVLDDFSRCYGKPPRGALKLCMREFANFGDARTVHTLFDQYIQHHVSKDQPLTDPDILAPILQVHSKRGELAKVIKTFNEISKTYNLEPTILSWNILIGAYGRVHEFDEAFACFSQLLESPNLKPDDYTIGTLMGMSTDRGDLESVIGLYQVADDLRITKSAAMIDCLVLAHVQDDRLPEAERICVEAVEMDLTGTRTRMWNYLIVGYALRRDLKSANRILQQMSSFDVSYDEFTYGALMQALAMVRQPSQAVKIMEEVLPTAGYKVNSFHYAIAMGGFVGIREFWMVFKLHRQFTQLDIGKAGDHDPLLLRARYLKDMEIFGRTGNEAERFQRSMEMFLEVVSSHDPQDISNTARKGMGDAPLDIAHPTSMYSFIIYILAQNHDLETAKQLLDRYQSAVPAKHKESNVKMISAMTLTKFQARDYDGVEECWNLALATVKEQGKPLAPRDKNGPINTLPSRRKAAKILYKHQIDLALTLSWHLKSLASRGEVDRMIITVNNYLKDGFAMDMRNWNTYIQLLCMKSRPKLAFEVCEKHLMRNWPGWSQLRRRQPVRNRLPVEIRAKRKNPRWYRPISRSLIFLARSYLDIEAMAAESKAYQYMLEDLGRLCPKTVHAIRTMERSGDEQERDILGRY
jgi:pentatricopeptide repeat-containing protein PET309